MKLGKFIIKVLLVCAFLAAANFDAAAKDDWLRVQSKNFQLVGNAADKDLRRVATKLEQFRLVFTQLFPNMKFSSPIPTRVVVFKDKKTFDQFKTIDWAAGYFQPGEDVNYIVLTIEGNEAETFPTIFHEYTHFLIDNSLGRANIPPWFGEGIAEYYERFLIENDQKVTLGGLNEGHLRLLQQKNFIPFETFFAVDYYSLHRQTKRGAQLFYAQSWLLLHYLVHGNGGARKAQLGKFVDLLLQGNKPKDAFQQAFQSDYAAIESELKRYAAQRNFTSTIVPFKEKLIFDNQMQVFPVTEAEAKAFQGDLLYHTRRLEEAEKVLGEALATDANSSLANAALGLVKLRQKKFVEAKNYLEKAIRADAQNYLAFYSYAFAISREGLTDYGFSSGYSAADAEKMRENLRKAINLNPNFAESYNLFAFVNFVRNEELGEAIEMIKKALAIAPGNQWYQLRLAELYFRQEDFPAARTLAQKILQTASTDELKIYAENTVRNINSLEKQLDDIKNVEKKENEAVSDQPVSDEEIARRREKAILESLNATLRKPQRNEKRLLGYVTKIDCQPKQIIFSVNADNQVFELRSDSFETLTLVSFESKLVDAEFGCGLIKKENLSVITFLPVADTRSKIAGEIISVEFVPKNFRFLSEEK
ncbi:MAG TPA: tetratricopeptide repeat protein [Pyrinomonadaceae bacterium]|nr:tetratricopeptide repeat protein [Pyrinomonadaceae bacterium]